MALILIIDDNPVQHKLFEAYCWENSLDAIYALSLDEGLQALKNSAPDMIFLDSRLFPYSNFTQTVPMIRDAGYEGKIIVISSDIRHPIFAEFASHPVDGCMDKFEITAENFEKIVFSHLRDRFDGPCGYKDLEIVNAC